MQFCLVLAWFYHCGNTESCSLVRRTLNIEEHYKGYFLGGWFCVLWSMRHVASFGAIAVCSIGMWATGDSAQLRAWQWVGRWCGYENKLHGWQPPWSCLWDWLSIPTHQIYSAAYHLPCERQLDGSARQWNHSILPVWDCYSLQLASEALMFCAIQIVKEFLLTHSCAVLKHCSMSLRLHYYVWTYTELSWCRP